MIQRDPHRIRLRAQVAFIVGYYGLLFVMSLYLQQRVLSSLGADAAFLPMMLIGLSPTP